MSELRVGFDPRVIVSRFNRAIKPAKYYDQSPQRGVVSVEVTRAELTEFPNFPSETREKKMEMTTRH
jgi:hypothetical protein